MNHHAGYGSAWAAVRVAAVAVGACAWAVAGPPDLPVPTKPWQPVGRIEHEGLNECSGIVASRRYPGIFWVHNDSGHPAVIYAIKDSGEVVAEVPVEGAVNIDWEDIAADEEGHLYLADTGNNFRLFPVRSVYQVAEPDPYASPVEPATVLQEYKYAFPGERFDAEGLYVSAGRLFIVSKPRGSRAAIYRLEPAGEDKHQLVEVAALPFAGATAADLSPDGKRLIVCTGRSVHLFPVGDDAVPLAGQQPVVIRYPGSETEACCFDGADLILASEAGAIYRIAAADLAAGVRFVAPAGPAWPAPR